MEGPIPSSTMFTHPDTWSGGNIDLLVSLGPSTRDRQISALQAIWQWRSLDGPYALLDVEPKSQPAVSVDPEEVVPASVESSGGGLRRGLTLAGSHLLGKVLVA
jgi:hypothetical protein